MADLKKQRLSSTCGLALWVAAMLMAAPVLADGMPTEETGVDLETAAKEVHKKSGVNELRLLGAYSRAEIREMAARLAREDGRVPVSLVLAVAEVGADFDSDALGRDGARGVMQIRPEFALQEFGVTENELWDPETNIRVGIEYLSLLGERYNGDWRLALAHYRRGESLDADVGADFGADATTYAARVAEAADLERPSADAAPPAPSRFAYAKERASASPPATEPDGHEAPAINADAAAGNTENRKTDEDDNAQANAQVVDRARVAVWRRHNADEGSAADHVERDDINRKVVYGGVSERDYPDGVEVARAYADVADLETAEAAVNQLKDEPLASPAAVLVARTKFARARFRRLLDAPGDHTPAPDDRWRGQGSRQR